MTEDDSSKWRLTLLRRCQEGSGTFTDVHPRCIRADILPLRHCRTCQSDRTYRPTSKPDQEAPSGKTFFFCFFLHIFLASFLAPKTIPMAKADNTKISPP